MRIMVNSQVNVFVRLRPLSSTEKQHKIVVCLDEQRSIVSVVNPLKITDVKTFKFNAVYGSSTTTATIFEEQIKKVVESSLSGINSTVLVYGQTGTGKTFTMEGSQQLESKGLYEFALEYILSKECETDSQREVSVSFIELYKENIHDLLSEDCNRALELKGDGTDWTVQDVVKIKCDFADQIGELMIEAQKRRAVGSTKLNLKSSRSHGIFIIEISSVKANVRTESRLYMIDLAGSERLSKSGSVGERMSEAMKINLSLTALTNVILALASKRPHIPYRNSKLTRLLKDSLGGTAEVAIIATCGPSSYNYEETTQTLKYAQRCMGITNCLKVNSSVQNRENDCHSKDIERYGLSPKTNSSRDSDDLPITQWDSSSQPNSNISPTTSFGSDSYQSFSVNDEKIKEAKQQLDAMRNCFRKLQSEEKAISVISEQERILNDSKKESAYYTAVIENFISPSEVKSFNERLVKTADRRPVLWDFSKEKSDESGKWALNRSFNVWIPEKESRWRNDEEDEWEKVDN